MKIQILAWETFIPYPRIANKTPAFYKKYEGLQVEEYSNLVHSNEIFASKSGLLGQKSGVLFKVVLPFAQILYIVMGTRVHDPGFLPLGGSGFFTSPGFQFFRI